MIRMTSELETNLVAVERIAEYCDVPTEVIFMCLYLLVFLIEQSICARGHRRSDFQMRVLSLLCRICSGFQLSDCLVLAPLSQPISGIKEPATKTSRAFSRVKPFAFLP